VIALLWMIQLIAKKAEREQGVGELYAFAALAWFITGPLPVGILIWFLVQN